MTVCISAINWNDVLLLIIDKRYGCDYSGNNYPEYNGKSVTWAEVHAKKIPLYTFVRDNIWNERDIYKRN